MFMQICAIIADLKRDHLTNANNSKQLRFLFWKIWHQQHWSESLQCRCFQPPHFCESGNNFSTMNHSSHSLAGVCVSSHLYASPWHIDKQCATVRQCFTSSFSFQALVFSMGEDPLSGVISLPRGEHLHNFQKSQSHVDMFS